MPALATFSCVPPVAFDRPMTLPLAASLAARLDAAFVLVPDVRSVGLDPRIETLEEALGLGRSGLAVRQVRLADGRRPTVVAVPASVWADPVGKAGLVALKRAARALGRRLLLVPEGALDRDPRIADALLIAACAGAPVAPRDRLVLLTAVMEAGGFLPLADAAELMTGSDDPVASVLALVAGRVIGLDLGHPIGPNSSVLSLAGRIGTLPPRMREERA